MAFDVGFYHRRVKTVAGFQKIVNLSDDHRNTALFVTFYIQRHQRIVYAQSQKEPAVAVCFVKKNSQSLAVVICKSPAFTVCGVAFKRVKNLVSVASEILGQNFRS